MAVASLRRVEPRTYPEILTDQQCRPLRDASSHPRWVRRCAGHPTRLVIADRPHRAEVHRNGVVGVELGQEAGGALRIEVPGP